MSSSVGAEDDDKVFSAAAAEEKASCSLIPPTSTQHATSLVSFDNRWGGVFSPQTGETIAVAGVS